MARSDNEVTVEFLQVFADAWNRHDVDALMEFMTDDWHRGQTSITILLKKSFPKNDVRIIRSQMPYNRFSELG